MREHFQADWTRKNTPENENVCVTKNTETRRIRIWFEKRTKTFRNLHSRKCRQRSHRKANQVCTPSCNVQSSMSSVWRPSKLHLSPPFEDHKVQLMRCQNELVWLVENWHKLMFSGVLARADDTKNQASVWTARPANVQSSTMILFTKVKRAPFYLTVGRNESQHCIQLHQ